MLEGVQLRKVRYPNNIVGQDYLCSSYICTRTYQSTVHGQYFTYINDSWMRRNLKLYTVSNRFNIDEIKICIWHKEVSINPHFFILV